MVMSNDIAERVKQIVVLHLGVSETNVTDTSRLFDDLGADSLDTVELAIAFEDEFGCEILDHAATIETVEDAVVLIEQVA
jgi:acyl carrier protein